MGNACMLGFHGRVAPEQDFVLTEQWRGAAVVVARA
eukprot:COSAG03_NODE_4680_length_1468_cov_7.037984_1_plen_35_part_10